MSMSDEPRSTIVLPLGSWSLLPLTVSWGSVLPPPEPPVALEPPLPPVAVPCESLDEQAATETAAHTRIPTTGLRSFISYSSRKDGNAVTIAGGCDRTPEELLPAA